MNSMTQAESEDAAGGNADSRHTIEQPEAIVDDILGHLA
jgi:hypothetical protein